MGSMYKHLWGFHVSFLDEVVFELLSLGAIDEAPSFEAYFCYIHLKLFCVSIFKI